ncbi:unnamed protein product, partial [Protopolystoma xenopodis]
MEPFNREDISDPLADFLPTYEPENLPRLPAKRLYRQRAHCNPWSDHSFFPPKKPSEIDWSQHYPSPVSSLSDELIRHADIGCGYGGLLFHLSTIFPNIRSIGIEIRIKVCDYVQEKIRALREQNPGEYENIACIRTNAMRFLPNYFNQSQLHKIFFLYPDPHFKRVKHKWRIITQSLLAVYAFLLIPTGRLYSATDVPELAEWIVAHLRHHQLFKEICYTRFECPANKQGLEAIQLLKG